MTTTRPRIPLPPWARKLVGFAALLAGVLLVGRQLQPVVPREVTLHVALHPWQAAGFSPRSVEVSLARGDRVLRTVQRRYAAGESPGMLQETVTVPAGRLLAHVSVTLDDRVFERDSEVTVRPGERLEVPAPAPP